MFLDKDSCASFLVIENSDIRTVIAAIDKGGLRIGLVINNKGKLLGTISDGDIRRGLLRGLTLDTSLLKIMNKSCLKANIQTNKDQISKMMRENGISQIPIISENNDFIGLEISDNLLPNNVFTPPVGGGYAKSVDSDGVTPVLVEALKEALSKIETLEAKVAALEGS